MKKYSVDRSSKRGVIQGASSWVFIYALILCMGWGVERTYAAGADLTVTGPTTCCEGEECTVKINATFTDPVVREEAERGDLRYEWKLTTDPPADKKYFTLTPGDTSATLTLKNTTPTGEYNVTVDFKAYYTPADPDELVASGDITLTFIIIKVDIKAEDGTSDPQEYIDADSDVAASYNTVKYKAVVTPSVAGTFTWSETSTNISLANANSQTVTVNAGANASANVDAESVKVEFTPTGSTTTCDDTHDLTVVHSTFTAYANTDGWGHGWWKLGLEPAASETLIPVTSVNFLIPLNIEAGWFPVNPNQIPGAGQIIFGPPALYEPTSNHTWDVPFETLLSALVYIHTLDPPFSTSSSIYDLWSFNCCHATIDVSDCVKVYLPASCWRPSGLETYLESQ